VPSIQQKNKVSHREVNLKMELSFNPVQLFEIIIIDYPDEATTNFFEPQ